MQRDASKDPLSGEWSCAYNEYDSTGDNVAEDNDGADSNVIIDDNPQDLDEGNGHCNDDDNNIFANDEDTK